MQVVYSSEDLRLAALARYAVVDTLPEAAFDRLAELATEFFRTPVALVSLVDQEHQFFKACLGMDLRSTDRSLSFCAHALDSDEVMVVTDATLDPRFQDNLLVTGPPHIRFYAGAPLVTPDGYRLGTLCIIDDRPRPGLSQPEERMLQHLAAIAMDELELRVRNLELEREAQANQQLTRTLQDSRRSSEVLLGLSELMLLDLPFAEVAIQGLRLISEAVQVDRGELSVIQQDRAEILISWSASRLPPPLTRLLAQPLTRGAGHLWRVIGQHEPVFTDHYAALPDAMPALVAAGLQSAAWLPLGGADGTEYVAMFLRFAPQLPWTATERALLRATGRGLQAALQERERQAQLQRSAFTDALTGLPNRRAFQDTVSARGDTEGLALAVLDLDGFKAINDLEGHARGDELLRVFASALLAVLPGAVQVFRTGGDEFVLLAEQAGADGWAEEVLAAVNTVVAMLGLANFRTVGASVGTALGSEGASLQEMLNLADRRMYTDKQSRSARPARRLPRSTGKGARTTGPTRPEPAEQPVWHFGALRLLPDREAMEFEGRQVPLSPKQLQVMAVLIRRPERVFTRQELIGQLWKEPSPQHAAGLNAHIRHLRKKLAALTGTLTVASVGKSGYALQAVHPATVRR